MNPKPDGVKEDDWTAYAKIAKEGYEKSFECGNLRQCVFVVLWRCGGSQRVSVERSTGLGTCGEAKLAFGEFLKTLRLPADLVEEATRDHNRRTKEWHFQAWMQQRKMKTESKILFCCHSHCWEKPALSSRCCCTAHQHIE